MTDTIANCPEVSCKHHNGKDGCKLKQISLSTDLFCLSYQRRYEAEYKELVGSSRYVDHTKCGR